MNRWVSTGRCCKKSRRIRFLTYAMRPRINCCSIRKNFVPEIERSTCQTEETDAPQSGIETNLVEVERETPLRVIRRHRQIRRCWTEPEESQMCDLRELHGTVLSSNSIRSQY
mmetsp:Transcript_18763/g.53483  ORF Transcript_18763/g.53483 Transcript_18763/m.53483 type:complete len:113 (-) Transcript_18763:511-849(-)